MWYRSGMDTLIFYPMWLVCGIAKTLFSVSFIVGIISLEPDDFAVAFKGQNMGGDAIQKPAIMRDNDGTARVV